MNVDQALKQIVIVLAVIFGGMWLWASSMSGDSGAGLVFTGITYVFCSIAVPLCVIGTLVSLLLKQGVKLGLVFGLASSFGLTLLMIVKLLFFP